MAEAGQLARELECGAHRADLETSLVLVKLYVCMYVSNYCSLKSILQAHSEHLRTTIILDRPKTFRQRCPTVIMPVLMFQETT